jgi:hypothetical protein
MHTGSATQVRSPRDRLVPPGALSSPALHGDASRPRPLSLGGSSLPTRGARATSTEGAPSAGPLAPRGSRLPPRYAERSNTS